MCLLLDILLGNVPDVDPAYRTNQCQRAEYLERVSWDSTSEAPATLGRMSDYASRQTTAPFPKLQTKETRSRPLHGQTLIPENTTEGIFKSTLFMDLQVENPKLNTGILVSTSRKRSNFRQGATFPTWLTYIKPPSGMSMRSQHSEPIRMRHSPRSKKPSSPVSRSLLL